MADDQVASSTGAIGLTIAGRLGFGGSISFGIYTSEDDCSDCGVVGTFVDGMVPDEIGVMITLGSSRLANQNLPSVGIGAKLAGFYTASLEGAEDFFKGIDVQVGGAYGYGAYTSIGQDEYTPNATLVAGAAFDAGVEAQVSYGLGITSDGLVARGEDGSAVLIPNPFQELPEQADFDADLFPDTADQTLPTNVLIGEAAWVDDPWITEYPLADYPWHLINGLPSPYETRAEDAEEQIAVDRKAQKEARAEAAAAAAAAAATRDGGGSGLSDHKSSGRVTGTSGVSGDTDDTDDGKSLAKSGGLSGEKVGGAVGGTSGANSHYEYYAPPEDDHASVARPILLDLDGDGIEITRLSASTQFFDFDGDGLDNRAAWAGAGDAVLFYDPDDTGEITERSQFVFTEWDPTAESDIEALRLVFDSNGDGVLDSAVPAFTQFKLMVTNADGSTEAKSFAELGITAINLTADTTHIALPDGPVITGQTSFTRSDGSARRVRNHCAPPGYPASFAPNPSSIVRHCCS